MTHAIYMFIFSFWMQMQAYSSVRAGFKLLLYFCFKFASFSHLGFFSNISLGHNLS